METHMSKKLPVILILLTVILTACSAGVQIPIDETPKPEEEIELVEAAPTEIEATDIPPTEEPATATADLQDTQGKGSSSANLKMECTLVSSQPEAPSEYAAIFSVKENDWVKGPDSAALTIVEYGDFQ